MKDSVAMAITALLSLIVIMCSCVNNQYCAIAFINKSDTTFDSAVFKINDCTFKLGKAKPSETVSKSILVDSIRTNNHDVTVTASLYSNGQLVKGGFYYNDLTGKINDEYTLTLHEDMTTSLK